MILTEFQRQAYLIMLISGRTEEAERYKAECESGRSNASADAKPKNCKLCGCKMVWEHPDIPGLFMASSCDMEDWPICHECMVEHCCQTNCLGCGYGKYPECQFLDMKKHYMEEAALDEEGGQN